MIGDFLDYIDSIDDVTVMLVCGGALVTILSLFLFSTMRELSRCREELEECHNAYKEIEDALQRANGTIVKLNRHANNLNDEKNELQKRVDGWNHTSKMCGVGELLKVGGQ